MINDAIATPGPATKATVGEIAASLAGATAVFRHHKIDFCCGGNVSIEEAAAKRGMDPAVLEAALAELAQTPPDAPTESGALVDHIIDRYHNTHRAELPELVRLARRVEAVHRDHPDAPAGLAAALAQATIDLEDHMQKEEQILFPAIRDGFKGALDGPIMVMRHEHDDHARTIRVLQTLTHSYQPPQDACRSWQALYNGVEKLVTDLTEHIHLENNVLFPRYQTPRKT